MKEKFVENSKAINSYLEIGDWCSSLDKGSTHVYIAISTGRKKGNMQKQGLVQKQLHMNVSKITETEERFSFLKKNQDLEKLEFNDEKEEEDFDPESYNIFHKENNLK